MVVVAEIDVEAAFGDSLANGCGVGPCGRRGKGGVGERVSESCVGKGLGIVETETWKQHTADIDVHAHEGEGEQTTSEEKEREGRIAMRG